jgi:hypothetical protein
MPLAAVAKAVLAEDKEALIENEKTALDIFDAKAKEACGKENEVLDEEKATLIRNLRESLAPHLVVEADGGVVEVGLVALVAELRKDAAGVDIEFLDRHWRHRIRLGDVVPDFAEEAIALGLGLRDVLLWLTETGRRDRHGPGHLDRGESIDWLGHRRTEEQRRLGRRGERFETPAPSVSLQQGIGRKSRIATRKMTIRDQG